MGNERGNITGKGGDEYGPKGEHRQRAYRERKTNRISEEVIEVLSDEISNDDDLRRIQTRVERHMRNTERERAAVRPTRTRK